MTSHFLLLVFFAACVATVMAVLQKDDRAEQVRLALYIAGGFVGTALVLGWLMYPLPL
jgi:predicted membrane channel-forming protein YqfA (hemolysin III family)